MWDTIGIDLIGPLPETSRRNKYYYRIALYFRGPKFSRLEHAKQFSEIIFAVSDFLNHTH